MDTGYNIPEKKRDAKEISKASEFALYCNQLITESNAKFSPSIASIISSRLHAMILEREESLVSVEKQYHSNAAAYVQICNEIHTKITKALKDGGDNISVDFLASVKQYADFNIELWKSTYPLKWMIINDFICQLQAKGHHPKVELIDYKRWPGDEWDDSYHHAKGIRLTCEF